MVRKRARMAGCGQNRAVLRFVPAFLALCRVLLGLVLAFCQTSRLRPEPTRLPGLCSDSAFGTPPPEVVCAQVRPARSALIRSAPRGGVAARGSDLGLDLDADGAGHSRRIAGRAARARDPGWVRDGSGARWRTRASCIVAAAFNGRWMLWGESVGQALPAGWWCAIWHGRCALPVL